MYRTQRWLHGCTAWHLAWRWLSTCDTVGSGLGLVAALHLRLFCRIASDSTCLCVHAVAGSDSIRRIVACQHATTALNVGLPQSRAPGSTAADQQPKTLLKLTLVHCLACSLCVGLLCTNVQVKGIALLVSRAHVLQPEHSCLSSWTRTQPGKHAACPTGTSASAMQRLQTASAASKPSLHGFCQRGSCCLNHEGTRGTHSLSLRKYHSSFIPVKSGGLNRHCCARHVRRDPTAPTFLRSAMTAFTSSTAAATAEDCSPSPASAGSRPLLLGMVLPLQIAAGLLLSYLAAHQLILHNWKHCSTMMFCTCLVVPQPWSADEL